MRAALRHLAEKGVEALKPQKITTKPVEIAGHLIKPPKEVWRRPVVSKRVGNVLRKQAIRDGTYGSFNTQTGVGWDPMWDLALKPNRFSATRYGGIRPPKKTKRERTREERANKVEEKLATQNEKIEEYYTQKEEARVQDMSFEARFKRLSRAR